MAVGLLALAIIPTNAHAQDLLVASQDGDLETVRTFVSAGADLTATVSYTHLKLPTTPYV